MKRGITVLAATALFIGLAPAASAAVLDPDQGKEVQAQMAHLGYEVGLKAARNNLEIGKKSREEILRFQTRYDLPISGRLGRVSQAALEDLAGSRRVPKRCLTGEFTICVDKHARVIRAVNADGDVVRVMDSRFGAEGMETREGKFRVYRSGRDHVSTEYDSPMPFSLFFDGGQAVHFSYEFRSDPRSDSHGCVGLRDYEGAEWLYDKSEIGTPVVVLSRPPLRRLPTPEPTGPPWALGK